MIYATCLNEQENSFNNDIFLLNLVTESVQTAIDYCNSELEILDEVNIDDKYKTKKTRWELVKDLVARLWKSFRDFCSAKKQSLMDLITKIRTKLRSKKGSNTNSSSSDDNTTNEKPKQKMLVLNDKFYKIDEKKLLSTEVINLSNYLTNYDKELFENFNMASYTESLVKDITGGEFSSVDDIKGKVLVEEKEVSGVNEGELNDLAKKYDAMISEVDNYFNKLQDSIKKAEAKFKGQIMPTNYSDDNIQATSNNPLETRKMQFIIQTSIKMIGAQSGIVRNIIYAKVDAISQVISSRAK